jgi:hypothetical protein
MIKKIYIPLFIFIVLGSVFNNLNAQNFIGSINDSIKKLIYQALK